MVQPAAAFAAGSGYTPPATLPPGGTASGLAGSVISSTTIQPSGGTAHATLGSATITATVAAGTFPNPTQVVISDATNSSVTPQAGGSAVVTFGIGFFVNGSKVTGTFPAVNVTVTSPAITAGSTVYFVTGGTLQAVSGASVKDGTATFAVTSDPTVEITAPAAAATTASPGSAIAGATSGHTGEPFLFEGGIAALLVLLGSSLLVALRLRRRTA